LVSSNENKFTVSLVEGIISVTLEESFKLFINEDPTRPLLPNTTTFNCITFV